MNNHMVSNVVLSFISSSLKNNEPNKINNELCLRPTAHHSLMLQVLLRRPLLSLLRQVGLISKKITNQATDRQ